MLSQLAHRSLLALAIVCACSNDDAAGLAFGGSTTSAPAEGSSGVEAPSTGGSEDGTDGTVPVTGGAEDAENGSDSGSDGGEDTGSPVEPPSGCALATHHSSELGWSAGQEVEAPLRGLLATLGQGDVVCFEDMYDITPSGSPLEIPDGVTLAALAGGGLRVTDIFAISGPGMFVFGNDVHLVNLTVEDAAPPFDGSTSESNNRTLFQGGGVSGLELHDCRFDTYAKSIFRLDGVSEFVVSGTEFRHSYYQMLITSGSHAGQFRRSLFHDSEGDGIKTGYGNLSDVRDMHFDECAFENNLRDGIDTTGGLRASSVERSLFWKLFSGLDIKTGYGSPEEAAVECTNRDIEISDCEFVDTETGAIVLTTIDAPPLEVTDDNAEQLLIHDIFVRDSLVEQRDGSSRAILAKDAHDIYWDGLQLLGGAGESKILGLASPGDYGNRPQLSMTNWNIEVTNKSEGPARAEPPQRPFDTVGPR